MLNLLKGIAEVLVEVGTGLFSNEVVIDEKETNNETYEYFRYLTYEEQEEYFDYNLDLQMYKDTHYYPNDREMTAKKAQELADKLGKEFTNKNKRY